MVSQRSLIIILYSFITFYAEASKMLHYSRDIHLIEHAVDLDTITFDKVISHQNVTVVMFMHYLAVGAINTEFKHFAESTVTQPEVIAATVPILEEGGKENWELAERFNLSMDQLPVVKVFVKGKENATMKGILNCDNFRKFVLESTGVWVGRAGTLEYLERLVEKFMKARTRDDQEQIIELARQYKEYNTTQEDHYKSATYYIKIFEEYMKQGPSFLGLEDGRMKLLKARHKMHKDNHCGIRKQMNILRTFQQIKVHMPHDEL